MSFTWAYFTRREERTSNRKSSKMSPNRNCS